MSNDSETYFRGDDEVLNDRYERIKQLLNEFPCGDGIEIRVSGNVKKITLTYVLKGHMRLKKNKKLRTIDFQKTLTFSNQVFDNVVRRRYYKDPYQSYAYLEILLSLLYGLKLLKDGAYTHIGLRNQIEKKLPSVLKRNITEGVNRIKRLDGIVEVDEEGLIKLINDVCISSELR